ncbi:hypothetical protein [Massilia sp. CCM 8734]|uniref:hypothetical protein n=1 Tax=Massilia sp. CCM 8734 TaxID=2609283 RepID=UPI001422BA3A|nr:hypothetical protein [Massilia sp. CCM 8734]NHZ95732.1 hypothetical protein [Massilia sp. CCM 8734]
MIIEPRFDEHNIRKIETILLGHPIARDYFQGELYDKRGQRSDGFTLERHDGTILELIEKQSAHLFMIPDGSAAWALRVNEHGNAPPGMNVQFINSFVKDGEQNSVIAFRSEQAPGVWCDALHIGSMMLSPETPPRFCTVAFGLMAVTAYRFGFSGIHLYGAGRGPLRPGDPDALIGYWVWPKLGFDAPVHVAEMTRHRDTTMHGLRTVQEVLAHCPEWWETYGSARPMQFHLRANSPSWSILLNYIWKTLAAC